MEPMDALKKPGIMAKLRNSKGFSLIEMAIVLVIIGIIIAAIVKGQDLMVNARAKQIVTTTNAWKTAMFAYMDRNGRFPGDNDKSGAIGDGVTEQATPLTAIEELATTLSAVPANPIIVGGQSYWMYPGYSLGISNPADKINVLVICKNSDCSLVLSPDDIELIKAVDTAIDNISDWGTGSFRGLNADSKGLLTTPVLASAAGGRDVAVVKDIHTTVQNVSGPWPPTGAGCYGAVWAFDKRW